MDDILQPFTPDSTFAIFENARLLVKDSTELYWAFTRYYFMQMFMFALQDKYKYTIQLSLKEAEMETAKNYLQCGHDESQDSILQSDSSMRIKRIPDIEKKCEQLKTERKDMSELLDGYAEFCLKCVECISSVDDEYLEEAGCSGLPETVDAMEAGFRRILFVQKIREQKAARSIQTNWSSAELTCPLGKADLPTFKHDVTMPESHWKAMERPVLRDSCIAPDSCIPSVNVLPSYCRSIPPKLAPFFIRIPLNPSSSPPRYLPLPRQRFFTKCCLLIREDHISLQYSSYPHHLHPSQ